MHMFNFFQSDDVLIPLRPDDMRLFNFKWQRSHIQRLHDLADERGTTASAIIKNLLLQEFKSAGV